MLSHQKFFTFLTHSTFTLNIFFQMFSSKIIYDDYPFLTCHSCTFCSPLPLCVRTSAIDATVPYSSIFRVNYAGIVHASPFPNFLPYSELFIFYSLRFALKNVLKIVNYLK
jgi:hypothetical protein